MTFFTQENGTLLPEKGHFAKLGGLAPPGPPVPTPLHKSQQSVAKLRVFEYIEASACGLRAI
jgi:hypothetical protein